MWRIKGSFTLKTPLHVGSGRVAPIVVDDASREDDQNRERFVATVVRDRYGRPCIPGSSLKGALNALARQADVVEGDHRAALVADESFPIQVMSLERSGIGDAKRIDPL